MEQDNTIIPELAEQQANLELGESLQRLKKNKDFKKLFLEMFLNQGCIILTKNMTVIKNEEVIFEELRARSYAYRFMTDIEQNYENAKFLLSEYQKEQQGE